MEFCLGKNEASRGGGGAPVLGGREGSPRILTHRTAFAHNNGSDPVVKGAAKCNLANAPNFHGFAKYHRVKFTANHGQDQQFVTGAPCVVGPISASAVRRDFIAHDSKSQVGGFTGFRNASGSGKLQLGDYSRALDRKKNGSGCTPLAAATPRQCDRVGGTACLSSSPRTRSIGSVRSAATTNLRSPTPTQLNADISGEILARKAKIHSNFGSNFGGGTPEVAPTVRDFGCVSVQRAPLQKRRAPGSITNEITRASFRSAKSAPCAGLTTFGNPNGFCGSVTPRRFHKGRVHQPDATIRTLNFGRDARSQPWDITNDVTRVAPVFRRDQAAQLRKA